MERRKSVPARRFMQRNSRQLKNAVLVVFIAIIAVASPIAGYAQNNDKEQILFNLGPLKSDGNGYSIPSYFWYTYSYSVPAGKRLVIEQVFLEIRTNTSAGKPTAKLQILAFDPVTLDENTKASVPIALSNQTTSSEGIFVTSQLMKLYVNPISGKTTKVRFYVDPQSSTMLHYSNGSYFSGYLEDAP
jgi:hypothetical protein